jgi:hypothetical protein
MTDVPFTPARGIFTTVSKFSGSGCQTLGGSKNARTQPIRPLIILSPQILIFPRRLKILRFPPRRAVSMDQLEPEYQVGAM